MSTKPRKQAPARAGETCSARPRAVTLVEVLLVLVVLTLAAAAAWPALERSFAKQRLRDAADLVRAEWASARAEAMRSGVAQQFHYSIEEQTYWVDPCEDNAASADDSSPSANVPADAEADGHYMTLPDEIYFHQGETQGRNSPHASSRQTSAAEASDPGMIENGKAGAAIVFYPDGTSASARLVLRNEYGRGITVTIRGLTGMSEAGETFYVEDQSP